MRALPTTLLVTLLAVSACGGSYERTVGGAAIGGVTGAMAGIVCCGDPVNTAGKGAVVGIIVGALAGLAIDWMSTE